MATYKVQALLTIEIDGDVDVNSDALELAVQDFFDMAEFPDSFEQPEYDEGGTEIEDAFETVMMNVTRADATVMT